jgi:hypothetical protein
VNTNSYSNSKESTSRTELMMQRSLKDLIAKETFELVDISTTVKATINTHPYNLLSVFREEI